MRAKLFLLVMVLWLLPPSAFAGTFEVRPDLVVVLPELPAPWIVTNAAPEDLIAHLAAHLQEDAAAKGHTLSPEAAIQAARERLGKDELFVFNPQTDAHVQISFSQLKKTEAEPDASAIALSAKYAASGVTDEGWDDVKQKHQKTSVKGAQFAQRFDIDYSHEGAPSSFLGIVGYARPFWFWVYGNDHHQAPADRQVIESVLQDVEIRSSVPR